MERKIDSKYWRKIGPYEKYVKRTVDVIGSFLFLVLFSWLYIVISLLVLLKLGRPILFTQYRPGLINPLTGKEQIFKMYKFRTMTNTKDCYGHLLPDDIRLTRFGRWLRSTSLDELPEVFCILKGSMSFIGPRPQLIRDMVFMSDKQRMRHTAKPGLSGLAQVKGRNSITWEEKLDWDLNYIEKINLSNDLKILFLTIISVIKKTGITDGENATALDYGDELLNSGRIDEEEYNKKQKEAKKIILDNV